MDLECYYALNPGPKVTIDSVIVQGNNQTRRQVILRESRIKMGELYNHKKVQRVRERLMRTGFFHQVDEPSIFVDNTSPMPL